MITIHELSREAYTEILLRMPSAIKEAEQDYDTVTIDLKPSVDISTNNMLNYVVLTHGNKTLSILNKHFHYISIS